MSLDILTRKGRETRLQEDDAVAIWHEHFPAFRYIHTKKDEPAKADAILVQCDKLASVVEMKCRSDLTLDKFMTQFAGEWLVTHQKIVDCVAAADLLRVKFVGMLYLVEEKALLYKVLWTPDDGYVCPFSVRRSLTQKTVNGGMTVRANAYLDMRDAKVLRAKVKTIEEAA